MSEKNEPKEVELVLESPPEISAPITSVAQSIFSEDSLAIMAAKLKFVEAMLKLIVRDIKFSEMMRECLTLVLQVIKCEAGSIFEANYAENILFFRAATGRSSDQVSNFTIPFGQGVVGFVAESMQPLLVSDINAEKRHDKVISLAVAFEVTNLIAVPIVVRGQTYGVLELLNRIGEPSFTSADQDLLVYVADSIARAVEVRMMINWAKTPKRSTA